MSHGETAQVGQKECKYPKCRKTFEPKREHQLYCQPSCRQADWQQSADRRRFGDPKFVKELQIWLERVEYENAAFAMIRRIVCSRIAKRQTPHGPGKRKGKL